MAPVTALPTLVPGLFQLREYAELVIHNAERAHLTEEKVQRGIDLRMDRQRALDQPNGPLVDVVIDASPRITDKGSSKRHEKRSPPTA